MCCLLQCEDAETACNINTGSFLIESNSTLVISGGCELVVTANTTVTFAGNSTISVCCLDSVCLIAALPNAIVISLCMFSRDQRCRSQRAATWSCRAA